MTSNTLQNLENGFLFHSSAWVRRVTAVFAAVQLSFAEPWEALLAALFRHANADHHAAAFLMELFVAGGILIKVVPRVSRLRGLPFALLLAVPTVVSPILWFLSAAPALRGSLPLLVTRVLLAGVLLGTLTTAVWTGNSTEPLRSSD